MMSTLHTRHMMALLMLMCWAASGPLSAQTPEGTVPLATRDAYSQPLPGLSDSEQAAFARGRSLFRQSWVVAPARDDKVDGLGPLYNRLACASCHTRNGRGKAPLAPDERMQSMLVRLSVPGKDAHGGPLPHPVYGDQLNEEGTPGVPGEGRAWLRWQSHTVQLNGGERVTLRKPVVRFSEWGYGPPGPQLLTSARVGQPVYRLGLLQAVPVASVAAHASKPQPDGVKGQLNQVWDASLQRTQPGRFGWKANQPNLRQQNAGASLGDLGLTSTLFAQPNCTPRQHTCLSAPSGGEPELSDEQLNDLTTYLSLLAVPAQREPDAPQVRQGQVLFNRVGCAACHVPQWQTGSAHFAALVNRTIAPYTDLLLHDMGAGLADGRPDFAASGRQWRTPALWGIGLSDDIGESSGFLHDGRARNLQEAVLWHGGEARHARQRYTALPQGEREALLAFLRSL